MSEGVSLSEWIKPQSHTLIAYAAQTMLRQLGGANRLNVMIGAHDFTGFPALAGEHRGQLYFAFQAGRRANRCTVTLTALDLYDVKIWYQRGGTECSVQQFDGIGAENLRSVFERASGLYLTL
jgi:hypothetical protein